MCEIHNDKFDKQWLLDVTEARAQHIESQENVTRRKADNTALAEYFVSNPLN